jgi:uncharacterized protein YprB with RNaseH-like and TPR domain
MKNDLKSNNISEQLRSLGVHHGIDGIITKPKIFKTDSLKTILQGSLIENNLGTTLMIEHEYPIQDLSLFPVSNIEPALNILRLWSNSKAISEIGSEQYIYLDIETTGLSGGSGTLAFLIGIGIVHDNTIHLKQLFLQDPIEEPAQLLELEKSIINHPTIVTYNGKSFDVPILNTRFHMNGWKTPLQDLAHIDLLILTRRLWRERLPSRTLGNVEAQILNIHRDVDDIPGWMVPEIYFDYIRFGETKLLTNVLYHNAMDVVSLVTLMGQIIHHLIEPLSTNFYRSADLIPIAKLYEEIGLRDEAINLYRFALDQELTPTDHIETLTRLAFLYKRIDLISQAVPLWKQATAYQHIPAYIELAKYYEHHLHYYHQAINWTREALITITSHVLNPYDSRQLQIKLEHRLYRLNVLVNKKPVI